LYLIVAHAVTNDGSDRAQLANNACQAKDALGVDELQAVADRGYFNSDEILACDKAGITVMLPKPMTSSAKAEGRFGNHRNQSAALLMLASGSIVATSILPRRYGSTTTSPSS
jgi:hypothetical protein